jgi:hypothetical protein
MVQRRERSEVPFASFRTAEKQRAFSPTCDKPDCTVISSEPRYFPGMTYWTDKPADFTTTTHFSVSSATSLPNSAGNIGLNQSNEPPSTAMTKRILLIISV